MTYEELLELLKKAYKEEWYFDELADAIYEAFKGGD